MNNNMQTEEWKDIPALNGKYQASSLGKIRVIYNTKPCKIRKLQTDKNGYNRVGIYVNCKLKSFLVHRLVAQAFIPNCEHKPMVNHIDGVKGNNDVSNLEWVTRSENAIHSFKIKKQNNKGINHPSNKLTIRDVMEIKAMLRLGIRQKIIAKVYDVHQTTIGKISSGKNWKHVS